MMHLLEETMHVSLGMVAGYIIGYFQPVIHDKIREAKIGKGNQGQ